MSCKEVKINFAGSISKLFLELLVRKSYTIGKIYVCILQYGFQNQIRLLGLTELAMNQSLVWKLTVLNNGLETFESLVERENC